MRNLIAERPFRGFKFTQEYLGEYHPVNNDNDGAGVVRSKQYIGTLRAETFRKWETMKRLKNAHEKTALINLNGSLEDPDCSDPDDGEDVG